MRALSKLGRYPSKLIFLRCIGTICNKGGHYFQIL